MALHARANVATLQGAWDCIGAPTVAGASGSPQARSPIEGRVQPACPPLSGLARPGINPPFGVPWRLPRTRPKPIRGTPHKVPVRTRLLSVLAGGLRRGASTVWAHPQGLGRFA